ncbi:hypothetical protein [Entomobacter blattae]|uniref:Secreted protein n=1 Tax=Entomobacter blattae TaxID=2762277 RepID=A0A7H1NSP2_9PROT|nr:hypothetical protein [Entomobacter blattae]QNT78802.1 hypothetical protein JGUZn3_15790 [Entomobacter blattae]
MRKNHFGALVLWASFSLLVFPRTGFGAGPSSLLCSTGQPCEEKKIETLDWIKKANAFFGKQARHRYSYLYENGTLIDQLIQVFTISVNDKAQKKRSFTMKMDTDATQLKKWG